MTENQAQGLRTELREACTGGVCLFFYTCGGFDGAYCSQGTCTMGSCGDGLVDTTTESCDDGAQTADCDADCDADCTAVECGDWTVNAAAGGKAVLSFNDAGLDPIVGDESLSLKMTFAMGSGLGFAGMTVRFPQRATRLAAKSGSQRR